MSIVSQQILDNLTQVPFPKGFNKVKEDEVRHIDGLDIPFFHYDAVVVGTGAAGLRAAVELRRKNVNVLLITSGLYMGTSACSGSDKQTLFTAATAKNGDNFHQLADALSAGGAMDKDIAYVEAVGSLHTLAGLQLLGLELPEDRYGSILRYQTDHDEAGRATSCGPRTSRLMVKVLLEETQRLSIPMLTGATALQLLKQPGGEHQESCAGLLISTNSAVHNPYRIGVVNASSVVLATGGPGDMYRDSVYPKKCYGSLGLALEGGLRLANIIESQFGIGTPRTAFPWNLSGTYVQVIPYIYSVDAEEKEHNFLARYYRSTQELASNIFRKGYQWPFHATRTLDHGSSLVDMAIADEIRCGRKVYMDFNRNPEPVTDDLPFSLHRLDEDVRAYLNNNGCTEGLPIERLKRMNPLAIELYAMHGHDITTTPLEFAVNNQHMNGGIDVDIWGESSLSGCFALGEVAGTHGVTRPGGAALNSGQVFGVRVAQKVAHDVRNRDHNAQKMPDSVYHTAVQDMICWAEKSLSDNALELASVKTEIRDRMSDRAGFVVAASEVSEDKDNAKALLAKTLEQGLKITSLTQLAESILWRHFALTSAAVMTMLDDFVTKGGGSRGARIIFDDNGDLVPEGRDGKLEQWRFRSEKASDKENKLLISWHEQQFSSSSRAINAAVDLSQVFFEKNWPDFLMGNIYK
ncbi:FAD-dependent oxidoreductase [Serratia ficaria]|uniref:FAD-dependent oxidoreductase n=1 Tax=Serratia ficaria TaxID=61651 RepID=UPI002176F631|nr:FAD-binding protein [Serratia ficaria]CAI0720726.1 succinate dehydrogenase flavoprotein subunit [Serratia ficaria]CAI1581802.1 succinate dehydrogenase flavoprotein subunit [Serratia ficaria]